MFVTLIYNLNCSFNLHSQGEWRSLSASNIIIITIISNNSMNPTIMNTIDAVSVTLLLSSFSL